MFGDFLREAAVLVLVFGPLDYLVSKPFTVLWFGVILLASAGFCAILVWWGMRVEERRW
jgi:hypothetical protein